MIELTWNFEAETALLGMVLMDNRLLHRVSHLAPDHFYEGLHQRIFEAILRKAADGETANPITLRAQFEADEALADIGGGKYLAQLCTAAPHYARPEDMADVIVSLHRKRLLLEACQMTLGTAESAPGLSFDELAAELVGRVQAIDEGGDSRKVRSNYDVTLEILADLKTRLPAVSTGLPRLDAAMGGGMYPGRSYAFTARKKVGKTSLAGTISYNLNLAGVKHLFVAGEMGAKEIHERNLCRALSLYPSRFRDGGRHDERLHREIAAYNQSAPRCAIYQDAPGLTFDQLRRSVASAVYKYRIGGFILDYWQLVGGKPKAKSTSEHLDEVAQWIADFCRQHGLWSVTMAQINQDGNTRGGEGLRLACDQVYQIRGIGDREDITLDGRWIEMMDTRYTKWGDVGGPNEPSLSLNEFGPYFEPIS